MESSFEIANSIAELNDMTDHETGFYGDVRIQGKLNDRTVSDYVLREELDEKADVDHSHEITNNINLSIDMGQINHNHF